MLLHDPNLSIWLYTQPTDMRKKFGGLAALAKNHMQGDLKSGQLFLFINRKRTYMKALYYSRGGLCLWCKRIERGHFQRITAENTGDNKFPLTWTQLQFEYEDAFYHVMNRGRDRQWVFPNPDYYSDYLKGLQEAHSRFGVEIHAYCLMGNHYHLLIKTPRGNLSRAMRHIDGLYTQRHNRRKNTGGSLFRGRYKAILIDASSYLLQVNRYIHHNPVESKTFLVEKLIDYPWSSYAAYLNKAMVRIG